MNLLVSSGGATAVDENVLERLYEVRSEPGETAGTP